MAIDKASVPIPEDVEYAASQYQTESQPSMLDEFMQETADSFADDLTEDDTLYLRLKWGKTYRPEE